MKKQRKRGFTLVELVIVIAVIAILAAVLIPTFANLIRLAKRSADEQTVSGMNLALEAEEIADQKKPGMADAFAILRDAGYNVPVEPSSSGYQYYWIAEDNRVVLVEMDGENPKAIVYPNTLAEKYGTTLPTEWYTLKPEEGEEKEECNHITDKGYEYVAIALDGGGSKYHMVICGNCNKVLVNDAPHDTDGVEGACSKCGFKKEKDSTKDPCMHAFDALKSYKSNGDGTHTKVCQICNNAFVEICTPDTKGKCVFCEYQQSADGHQHNFTYEFVRYDEDQTTGYHKRTCSTENCPITEESELVCSYAEEDGVWKCIYCKKEAPANFKSKGGTEGGIVDGYYYKNNRLFTGQAGGYNFEYGKLVVTDSGTGYEWNKTWNFKLPNDEQYLTDKVVLEFPQANTHFNPQDSYHNTVKFSGTMANSYTAVDIKVDFEKNIDGALSMLKNAISSGKTEGILELINNVYGLDGSSYPVLTDDPDFKAYLADERVNSGVDYNAIFTDDMYANFVNSEISFGAWLKEKYNCTTSLLELPWSAQNGKWDGYNSPNDCLGAGNVVEYNDEYVRPSDPDYILWYWNFTYTHVYWFALANSSLTSLASDAGNPYSKFYGTECQGENWKDVVGPLYSAKIYSNFDLIHTVTLTDLDVNNNTFCMVSGSHGALMRNAWQAAGTNIDQNIEIMLNKKA